MLSALLAVSLFLGPDIKLGVAYKTVDDKPVLMDFYSPEMPVRTPVPVVVLIHGGSWMGGSRNDMTPLAVALAKKGLAVANIDYRLAPKSKWPAMIVDCRDAVRFLMGQAKDYGIDPDRIGAMGASAGGHLALLLGADSGKGPQSGPLTQVRAVVNLFGPTDLSKDFDKSLASMMSQAILGKKVEDSAEDIKDFSPVTHISKSSSPVYTIHGTKDPVVPVVQADHLDDSMKAAGVEHTKVIIEGMVHGVTTSDESINKKIMTALDKSMDWLVNKLSK